MGRNVVAAGSGHVTLGGNLVAGKQLGLAGRQRLLQVPVLVHDALGNTDRFVLLALDAFFLASLVVPHLLQLLQPLFDLLGVFAKVVCLKLVNKLLGHGGAVAVFLGGIVNLLDVYGICAVVFDLKTVEVVVFLVCFVVRVSHVRLLGALFT